MTLRPGNEIFQYIVSWTEPSLFDTPYALSVSGQYRQRLFQSEGRFLYDENRLSFPISIGRELGELWDVALTARFERIKLTDIAVDAPVDVFEAAGPDTLVGLGLTFTRSTITTFTRPGEGTRFETSIEQVGGDYNFTKMRADYVVFFTTHRDFLGRRQILKLTSRMGYIFGGEAPLYERYYMGGRTFRGFEFRTVSPKGIDRLGNQTTDPVGGDWMLFLGAQYEVPIIQESVTWVVFLDTGTVTDKAGFDEYRVSAGFGLRIYIGAFGPVPIALDFGFPLKKEPGDETETFSFSAELPF
jgi:outer membrane protein insertion porin family